MDRQVNAIIALSLLAVVLSLSLLVAPEPTLAQVTTKDRDYTVVTARTSVGSDGLYIADNRTGMVAVFTYDLASRSIRTRTVRPLSDAFQQR